MIIIQQRNNWLLKAKEAKNLKQSNEVAFLMLSRMFCVQESTNFAILLQAKQWTTDKVQLDDEGCQQKGIDYEQLKKMRRSRRLCRFLAYIGIASSPFNFPSLKELCCRTSGLKHSSYIQYVIVYQKRYMLI